MRTDIPRNITSLLTICGQCSLLRLPSSDLQLHASGTHMDLSASQSSGRQIISFLKGVGVCCSHYGDIHEYEDSCLWWISVLRYLSAYHSPCYQFHSFCQSLLPSTQWLQAQGSGYSWRMESRGLNPVAACEFHNDERPWCCIWFTHYPLFAWLCVWVYAVSVSYNPYSLNGQKILQMISVPLLLVFEHHDQ